MIKPAGFHGFTGVVCPLVFSLLAVVAILGVPLLTFQPVSADWGPEVRLTNDPAISQDPHIAISGNSVHAVWLDTRDGSTEVYYKRSTDGGSTWGADTRLSSLAAAAAFDSFDPAVAAIGNNVHVVWTDTRDGNNEIYYKRSMDGGTTWGADTRLTNNVSASDDPRVAAMGNSIYVVWSDMRDGNPEIYFKRSTDGGATWGADIRLTNDVALSLNPAVAVSQANHVHVVWRDTRTLASNQTYYKRSIDGGATWGPDTRLSTGTPNAVYPAVAVWLNNVHVVWDDFRDGNDEIYFRRSADAGASWGEDTRLTNNPAFSITPTVAAWGNNIQIAWVDYRDGPAELYYKRSTDGGANWGSDTGLTHGHDPAFSNAPFYPDIAASGNAAHVVWYDTRDGNREIYYKKFMAAPAISSINPNHGMQGQTLDVVITGANFAGTTKVSFGEGIVVNSFYVTGNAQISVKITIGGTATPGIRSVSVFAPGGYLQIGINNHFTVVPKTKTPNSASIAVTPLGPVSLPSIFVKSASLSATKVSPGTSITVTADVVNTGTVNGSSSIKVYVNGEVENSQGVMVNSGSSTPVTFTVSRNEPGTYSVYVGGTQAGSFTVDQFADPNIILYISGALLVFAFIVGLLFILRRRQTQ
jgi:hypothetical protein